MTLNSKKILITVKKLFFGLIVLFSISMLVPMSFGELYYNNEYSFSVQYPDNWRVDDQYSDDDIAVMFMDGVEEGSVYSIWESNTMIYPVFDMGYKLSDYEEKTWARESSQQFCNESNYANNDYRCGSFAVVSQVSGKSLDGYPTITTKSTETRQWPDNSVGTVSMIVVEKLIYVDDDLWVIVSSTDADKFSEYEDMIYATMNSFRYPASPPIENSSSGGGCLIATATYGSEMAPAGSTAHESYVTTNYSNTESGSAIHEHMSNDVYYSFSPAIADMEREHPMFKEVVKACNYSDDFITVISWRTLTLNLKYLGLGLSVIMH